MKSTCLFLYILFSLCTVAYARKQGTCDFFISDNNIKCYIHPSGSVRNDTQVLSYHVVIQNISNQTLYVPQVSCMSMFDSLIFAGVGCDNGVFGSGVESLLSFEPIAQGAAIEKDIQLKIKDIKGEKGCSWCISYILPQDLPPGKRKKLKGSMGNIEYRKYSKFITAWYELCVEE